VAEFARDLRRQPYVSELHIAEIKEERLKEVAQKTMAGNRHDGLPEVAGE